MPQNLEKMDIISIGYECGYGIGCTDFFKDPALIKISNNYSTNKFKIWRVLPSDDAVIAELFHGPTLAFKVIKIEQNLTLNHSAVSLILEVNNKQILDQGKIPKKRVLS